MPAKSPKAEAAWLAAFGEPTRLAILRALAAGERTVTQLAVACGVELVNVSHHLGVLKDIGLVTVERDGRFMRYALAGGAVGGGTLTLAPPSGAEVMLPLG